MKSIITSALLLISHTIFSQQTVCYYDLALASREPEKVEELFINLSFHDLEMLPQGVHFPALRRLIVFPDFVNYPPKPQPISMEDFLANLLPKAPLLAHLGIWLQDFKPNPSIIPLLTNVKEIHLKPSKNDLETLQLLEKAPNLQKVVIAGTQLSKKELEPYQKRKSRLTVVDKITIKEIDLICGYSIFNQTHLVLSEELGQHFINSIPKDLHTFFCKEVTLDKKF